MHGEWWWVTSFLWLHCRLSPHSTKGFIFSVIQSLRLQFTGDKHRYLYLDIVAKAKCNSMSELKHVACGCANYYLILTPHHWPNDRDFCIKLILILKRAEKTYKWYYSPHFQSNIANKLTNVALCSVWWTNENDLDNLLFYILVWHYN